MTRRRTQVEQARAPKNAKAALRQFNALLAAEPLAPTWQQVVADVLAEYGRTAYSVDEIAAEIERADLYVGHVARDRWPEGAVQRPARFGMAVVSAANRIDDQRAAHTRVQTAVRNHRAVQRAIRIYERGIAQMTPRFQTLVNLEDRN